MALLVGNDAYLHVSKLEKAGNDASAMARELKAAGFEVELRRDINFRTMVKSIESFTSRISGGDQVIVFYAGHGVQIKSGNYLLPVDIEVGSESEIEKTAYSLDDLTAKLAEAKASFSLVMIDACRDNPLKAAGRSVGGGRGLSSVEPPKGQMVVFSASRGQQALDKLSDKDKNPNGVFTREFIARMKTPNVKVQGLMVEVQDAVEGLARSVDHDQRPALYNESRGSFYFYGSGSPKITITSPAGSDAESETWNAANSSNSQTAYQAYLKAYPSGRYITAANIKMDALKQVELNIISSSIQIGKTTVRSKDDADTALWEAVEQGGTTGDYTVYLQKNPQGNYVALAKQRLQMLSDKALADTEAAVQGDWNVAQRNNTEASYSSFMKIYPTGAYAALAKARIEKLRLELIQTQRESELKKTQELAEKAEQQEVLRLKANNQTREAYETIENSDWATAQSIDTEAGYSYYLKTYPEGRFVDLSKVRFERIKREELRVQKLAELKLQQEQSEKLQKIKQAETRPQKEFLVVTPSNIVLRPGFPF